MPFFLVTVSLFLLERLFSHALNSDGVEAVFARFRASYTWTEFKQPLSPGVTEGRFS